MLYEFHLVLSIVGISLGVSEDSININGHGAKGDCYNCIFIFCIFIIIIALLIKLYTADTLYGVHLPIEAK